MNRLHIFTTIILLLTSVSCTPPPESAEAVPPWEDVPMTGIAQPMSLPSEPVTVTESARYTPPDGKIWPVAIGYTGQTMWGVEREKTTLYSCANSMRMIGDENYRSVPTSVYQWDIDENFIEEFPLDPPPPDSSWMQIPLAVKTRTSSGFLEQYWFGILSQGGVSSTRAVTIEDSEPIDLPLIDSVSYYDTGGRLVLRNNIDQDHFELSTTDIFVPCDRMGASVLVFKNYLDYLLKMPDGVTRIAINWTRLDLINNQIAPFGEEIDLTLGAELTGFSKDPGMYFFVGESPFDGKDYTYIKGTCCVKTLPAVDLTDDGIDNPLALRITGYIPSARYQNSIIMFAEYGDNGNESETTHVAALRFNSSDPLADDPYIVWHGDVPNIFGVSTVIYAGTGARPYILTLDPTTGDITVFDPLLGSIRYEGNIEIAQWRSGMNLAGFVLTYFPTPYFPIAYIHDPNANEIIELRLDVVVDNSVHGTVAIE